MWRRITRQRGLLLVLFVVAGTLMAALQIGSGGKSWLREGEDALMLTAGGVADVRDPVYRTGGGESSAFLLASRFLVATRFARNANSRIDQRFQDDHTIRVGPIGFSMRVTAGNTRGCPCGEIGFRQGDRDLPSVNLCGAVWFPSLRFLNSKRSSRTRLDFELSVKTLESARAENFIMQ